MVKRILLVGLLTLVLNSLSSGQSAKPKLSQADQVSNALMQLERDIGKANIESDYAFFDRVEADEFIFTDSGGGITTKQQDLAGLKQPADPDVKLVAYDVDQMKVMLYGQMAVVTGRVTTKRMVKGAPVTGQSRFTDVFIWRQGHWQIVAGHSSRIRTP